MLGKSVKKYLFSLFQKNMLTSVFYLTFKADYLGKQCMASPSFLGLWILIALDKIYFFHMVQVSLYNLLGTVLKVKEIFQINTI